MFNTIFYTYITIFTAIEYCSSETITLHGPNDETYTYDNSLILGEGFTATVYKGFFYILLKIEFIKHIIVLSLYFIYVVTHVKEKIKMMNWWQ